MSRKLFSEILSDVAQAATPEEKVAVLQQNNTLPLRQVLAAALDPTVKFDVQIPSYRENEETDGYAANTLYVEYRRLYIFTETYKNVSPQRKTALLAQILESIDRSDALVLIDIINKDVSKYGLTTEIVNTAFPGLIKESNEQ